MATWHTACASLESVTLADAAYVHNRCCGWVTREQLLTARGQLLQHRAAELCKREAALEEGRRVHGFAPELGVEREGGASIVAITA
jgi:hypothetical protein